MKEYAEIKALLNEGDRVIVDQVLALFEEVDARAEEFRELTGIRCPDMCGSCCSSLKVETTAVEMLPMAVELWRSGEADDWLRKIRDRGERGACVFYKGGETEPERGRCMVYSTRPLICRLFGFFTTKDKNGNYVYGSCKVIKDKFPESYQKASRLIGEGFHPSNMTDFAIRLVGMGSDLARKMLPVNRAAALALEKVGFELEKGEWGKREM